MERNMIQRLGSLTTTTSVRTYLPRITGFHSATTLHPITGVGTIHSIPIVTLRFSMTHGFAGLHSSRTAIRRTFIVTDLAIHILVVVSIPILEVT